MNKADALVKTIRNQKADQVDTTSVIKACIDYGLVYDQNIDYGEWQPYMNTTREEEGIYQTPQQIADVIMELYKYNIKTYLEIGVFKGGSHLLVSEFLKLKNPEIQCTGLDITDEYLSKEVKSFINFVKGTSDIYQGAKFDLTFIDAGHNYDEVKRDYYNIGVNSNIVMFHDINEKSCPGVIRFWDEIKKGKKYKEYLYQTEGNPVHGIGLLFQNEPPEPQKIFLKSKALIITRCTRQDNLKRVYQSIVEAFANTTNKYEWVVLFDIFKIENIKSSTFRFLKEMGVKWYIGETKKDHYTELLNEYLKKYKGDATHLYLLDDDNLMHPEFTLTLSATQDVILWHQIRWDWVKFADPNQVQNCNCTHHMDAGQFIISLEKLKGVGYFSGDYCSDGITLDNVLKAGCTWKIINKVLAYYNIIGEFQKSSKTKIALISDVMIPNNEFCDVVSKSQFENIKDCKNKNPDLIVIVGEESDKYKENITKSLLLVESFPPYQDIISYAVKSKLIKKNGLISIFTSAYNIDTKIIRTWNSVKTQEYSNWEWTIVNDSEDGGVTEEILKSIEKEDPRVKVYSFNKKSGGCIGEAKYRASMLCNGEILVELDHDDELLSNALSIIKKAFDEYPDCGFAYSDAVELKNGESQVYEKGFAMGYGKYYKQTVAGKEWDVSNTPEINPLTIRHIASVPNHVRAWKADLYRMIGGHNRLLRIADDYELIVRTFLATKFIKIPTLLYLQNLGETTQDVYDNRADIQRKVKAIYEFYNDQIKERFESLGVKDWGFVDSQEKLWKINPRFGNKSGRVNEQISI